MTDIVDYLTRCADIAMGVTVPAALNNPNPTVLRADPFQPSDMSSGNLPAWIFELPQGMNKSDVPIASGQQYINTAMDAFLCVARREANVDLKFNVMNVLPWRNPVYAEFSKHVRLSDPARIVIAATNASPIKITTYIPHRYVTGDQVTLSGILGNTAANGPWNVTVVDYLNFTLNGSTGNGAFVYDNGGVSRKTQPFDFGSVVTAVITSWGQIDQPYGSTVLLGILFRLQLREMFVTTIQD